MSGEPSGEMFKILDCDENVVDTAETGAKAMEKKEEIEELAPCRGPYEIE